MARLTSRTLLIFILLLTSTVFAQDKKYARKIVDTLTSPFFWGRGYTNNGMQKAAEFIASEFRSFGVEPLHGSGFYQEYSYPVNSFPGKMKLKINGKKLVPGKDFLVAADSKGIKAQTKVGQKDSVRFFSEKDKIHIKLENKLTWWVSQEAADYTAILIDRKSLTANPKKIKIHVENRLLTDFKARNVAGVVKGTISPDSIIFITAHYDHLGGMGSATYFPGANDNASGIALLLNLAKYYSANPQPYSIGFICFSGEEAGLLGSKFFTEHPLVDLKKIRFLLNLDLTGTGNEGITVVNATEFKGEFDLMKNLNESEKLLPKINSRGKASNSDHYWFSEKGVPSFFVYTSGGIKAYHDIYDQAATLPLTAYDGLFRLITQFNSNLMKQNYSSPSDQQ